MAYNREWDKGKDAWADGAAWYPRDAAYQQLAPRPGVRPRDEDYYGDGKRRKFNGGGYDNSAAYDDALYPNPGAPQDFPQPGGAASKKRLVPSEASPHVIFLGLDPDFNEADLQSYLHSNRCAVDSVTIIRERATGTSKGFGFAQFPSTEHARAFVDPHFPFISVPPPASHGATAASAYYKALETGAPHSGRRIKIDYSQSVSPQDKGRVQRGTLNDGTRDIGNTQAPVLLFRGLDPLSGPQAIHQAMRNSAGFGKDGAKGMKRIILIKDKMTMASFGFGFVEFVDTMCASAVLANTMSPQIHPNGFRISDKPVAASFAHPHSFQPVADIMLRDEASITSSMSLGGVEGTFVRYWDENATVAVLEFRVEQPSVPPPVTKEKEKRKKPKAEAEVIRPIQTVPSALPLSDKPVTLSFKSAKVTSTGIKPKAPGFSMDDALGDEATQEPSDARVDKTAAARKVAPLAASKKIANNITKWNQVQEELTGSTGEPALPHPTSPPVAAAPSAPSSASVASTGRAEQPVSCGRLNPSPSTAPSDNFEFSDVNALMCVLCGRQFKSVEQLGRHNKESDLHKKNLQQEKLRDASRRKLASRMAKSGSAVEDAAPAQPKYRDRASERRTLFNQPDFPLPEASAPLPTLDSSRQQTPPLPTPMQPPIPAQDGSNIGNKLLKMMGWQEGTGLGVDGEGRVDPIITNMYASGAGLGASKGREVGKYADGYSGYVHMAQDLARERFSS